MDWEFQEHSPNVHSFNYEYPEPGTEHWVLLLSDIHWDNPKCKRDLLKLHLDQALEFGAPVIMIGDTFCAMQGKYDRRSNKSDIRPEHQKGDYLDALVNTAFEWFKPYKDNLALIGYGNHETSIQDRHETDLIDRLCYRLRDAGGIARAGGYGGWVRWRFNRHKTKRGSVSMYYHHGFGGGGPITRGLIDASRYMLQVNADIYACGHVHYRMHEPMVQASLNARSLVKQKQVDFVRLGTYKDEYKDGSAGYHIEKGRGPRSIGGYWLRWYGKPQKSPAVSTDDEAAIPLRQFITTDEC